MRSNNDISKFSRYRVVAINNWNFEWLTLNFMVDNVNNFAEDQQCSYKKLVVTEMLVKNRVSKFGRYGTKLLQEF